MGDGWSKGPTSDSIHAWFASTGVMSKLAGPLVWTAQTGNNEAAASKMVTTAHDAATTGADGHNSGDAGADEESMPDFGAHSFVASLE